MKTIEAENLQRDIAEYAYHLYEQRGCEPGHEMDDWLEAERRLASRSESCDRSEKRSNRKTPTGELAS